jgi:hypothetical protein
LTVDNPLKRSSTVASLVDVTVWQALGKDIEFYLPTMGNYIPKDPAPTGNTVKNGEFMEIPTELNDVLQTPESLAPLSYIAHTGVYTEEDNHEVIHKDGDNSPEPFIDAQEGSAMSYVAGTKMFGERIVSLRALTRKFSPISNISLQTGGTEYGNPVVLDPHHFATVGDIDKNNLTTPIPGASTNTDANFTQRAQWSRMSFVDYWSHLYRFYSGSMRYKTFSQPCKSDESTKIIAAVSNDLHEHPFGQRVEVRNYDAQWTRYLIKGGPETTNNINHNFVTEVEVPYLRTRPIGLVTNSNCVVGNKRGYFKLHCTSGTAGSETKASLYKAAGDNFSFGHIVGAPPIALTGNAVPAAWFSNAA